MINALLRIILISLCLVGLTYADDDDSGIDNPHAYHIQNDLDLVSTSKVVYDKPKIIAKLVYPKLTSDENEDTVQDFNEAVDDLLKTELDAFKTKVADVQDHQKTLPKNQIHNNMTVDFDSATLNITQTPLFSVRFVMEDDITGMAHPSRYHRVLNMTLDGETLQLDDIFKSDANYLFWLSNYITHALEKKLKHTSVFTDALTPTPEHFTNWNLTPDGICFTFDEATVAPYFYGTQTVVIPYSKLQPMLNPDSPLGKCLQHEKKCLRNHVITGGFTS